MGKGTILSEQGEGKYTIQVDYGSDRVSYRVAILENKIDGLTDDIAALASLIAGVEADYAAEKAAVDVAVDAMNAALASGGDVSAEIAAVNEATANATGLGREISLLTGKQRSLEAEKRQMELSKASLLDLEVEKELEAWCADYTVGKSGEVATLETPGEPAAVLIAPSGRAPTEDDGLVLARGVLDPNQLYFNVATLPGWQKFLPTYRFGEITSLDLAQNTCSVTLDPTYSTAQGLNINQTATLENVPVEYMSCNATAFDVGDRVVVAFENQDWESPKVIGFEKEPNPCGLLTANGYFVCQLGNFSPFTPSMDVRFYLGLPEFATNFDTGTGMEITINGNAVPFVAKYATYTNYQYSPGGGLLSQLTYVPGDMSCGADKISVVVKEGTAYCHLVIKIDGQTRVDAILTPDSFYPSTPAPQNPAGVDHEDDCFYEFGPAVTGQTMTVTKGGIELQADATWMSYAD